MCGDLDHHLSEQLIGLQSFTCMLIIMIIVGVTLGLLAEPTCKYSEVYGIRIPMACSRMLPSATIVPDWAPGLFKAIIQ